MSILKRIIPSALTEDDHEQLRQEQEGRDDEEQINECGYVDED